MNKYIPLILFFGILFNSVCVLVFRIKSERRYSSDFESLSSTLKEQVASFSKDALFRIDNYFASNNLIRSSSSTEPRQSINTSSVLPVFSTAGDWDFIFWLHNGQPRARVVDGFCSLDYKVGDFFPRGGGRITSIHPDGVSVNNTYWINNRSLTRSNSSPSISKPNLLTSNQPTNKPFSKRHELTANRMR